MTSPDLLTTSPPLLPFPRKLCRLSILFITCFDNTYPRSTRPGPPCPERSRRRSARLALKFGLAREERGHRQHALSPSCAQLPGWTLSPSYTSHCSPLPPAFARTPHIATHRHVGGFAVQAAQRAGCSELLGPSQGVYLISHPSLAYTTLCRADERRFSSTSVPKCTTDSWT